MTLDDNFIDFIECLNNNEVHFILIGGYASVIHGHSRTTGDMDFFVERTKENAVKLIKAIADFGFASLGFTTGDVMDESVYITMGVPPVKIDILTSIDAVTFEDAYKDAFEYQEGKLRVKVIHINHLINNKIAAGRPKDMDDVNALLKIKNRKNK